ncbi:MAG: metalloregulator ArsR/SmtB family transcription factor [Alphaproteobacteria bacterium]|jgi:ubiquinone/menaquinone biosynthesis C-methylase UbiE/DNA-binding transcriptional ArsR family regulator|nr:metalloregulator ArsR/SmtB family transcription factor [Alphaproteobacteria bacterium]
MDELLAGLRAAAESTRIRILFVLSHGEFNVSELTQILGQSQPRVSRHLKLMTEAGLITRHKEGNWVLFRLREGDLGGALSRAIVDLLPGQDTELARDLARLEEVRATRAAAAARYFSNNAAQWETLRRLHVREEDVEAAMLHLAGPQPIALHADLGTGTGSVLKSFARLAGQSIGIDSSREMLAVARTQLDQAGIRHAQVRHGDIYALPFSDASADFVTIHQVLHFLDDPARAVAEAARILKPGGRILIADFAPHDMEQLRENHAHRRLGIGTDQMMQWLQRAGLVLAQHDSLAPPWRKEGTGLSVSLWLAGKPTTPSSHRTTTFRTSEARP